MALDATSRRLTEGDSDNRPIKEAGHPLVVTCGWFVTSYLVSMLAWAFVPAVVMNWTPTVIVSGSMAPAIRPGDVVLIDPTSTDKAPGAVLAFALERGKTVLHRVARTPEPGIYVTKGDANLAVDSTPVPEAAVFGQARLVVPLIGYPKVWAQDSGIPVIVAAGGLLLVIARHSRVAMLLAVALIAGWLTLSATAAFADVSSSGQSGLDTTTLQPPTNLNVSCPAGIGEGSQMPVNLSWTASPTPGLTGYQVFYDAPPAGGGYTHIGTVTAPQTSFTHNIPSGQLALGQPHTYRVRAAIHPWVSADSVPDTVTITAVLFLYVCS